jgi:hypothetical protein
MYFRVLPFKIEADCLKYSFLMYLSRDSDTIKDNYSLNSAENPLFHLN